MPSAPISRAARNAAIVFSGKSADAPRCACTAGWRSWPPVPGTAGVSAVETDDRRFVAGREGAQGRALGPAHLAEAVAHGADRLDEVRMFLAELRSQTADVDVDRAGAAVVLVPPDPAEQG